MAQGEFTPSLHAEAGYIKFLGTAGARFVVIKQLRASGGIWVFANGKNVLIDPGPGSIVQCSKSRPRLDTSKLDAIILTHRHLDHCGDINVMVSAYDGMSLQFCDIEI